MSKLTERINRFLALAETQLWILSGEDKYIIKDSTIEIQRRFTRISLLVASIILLCFVGSFVFFEYAFDLPVLIEILLGLFVAAVTGNLYVLLLYTITPILFDKRRTETFDKEKYTLFGALTIRVVFITLLAMTMAQPVSVLMLSRSTDEKVEQYKTQYLKAAYQETESLLKDRQLDASEKKAFIERENKAVGALLESSHFFVKRLTILSEDSIAYWLINLGVWLLFFYPIFEKYNIRNQKRFYITRRELENRIVKDEYESFKMHYESIMEQQINAYNSNLKHALAPVINAVEATNPQKYQELYHEMFTLTATQSFEKFELWEDAPFKTIKKELNKKSKTEQDLLRLIYPSDSNPQSNI
ncbi:DUF4407 domain-containing protein [Dyadobacter chenhuakuii]|uniref:DUF4407 domain-containing protein n=1 Tax=Dyadobacter chenhuakuii TaxID=2909339 RepID=A0A9X1TVU1_9BACT|nr:hypothetical protein [Dyadobacter chenhuakuii]MCF2500422.1 hypothetical protein [Dyadobacter chenhuakuii]